MRKNLFIIGVSLLVSSCGFSEKKGKTQLAAECISNTSHKASSVYLTKDEKNNPVMSWCETDNAGTKLFFLSVLNPETEKFSPPIAVPIEQVASIHEEGMPKVAIKGDGSIVAIYETTSPTIENPYAGAIHFVQSFDKGKTWTLPHSIHADTSSSGSHSFASMTILSNGEIGACWLDVASDEEKSGRPVKFASTDGSSGFRNEVLIDRRACECCRTAISADVKGNISVVYRAISDSVRDISISSSTDNGRTFSHPVPFSNDNWVINGCPHNGPSVVKTKEATYTTWFTGGKNKGVYYGEIEKEGKVTMKKQLSPGGRNSQLCLLPGGERVIVYSEQINEGDSVYSRLVANKAVEDKLFALNITPEKAHAVYPVVSTYGESKVVIAWTENDKVFYKLIDAGEIADKVNQPSSSPKYKIASIGRINVTNDVDPICGMPIGSDVADTTFVTNKVIGFCSGGCKKRFMTSRKLPLGIVR